MADSTALRLTTGIDPGRPRQVGQVCVLGSAPNSVGQPQNIFEAVFSSTWTSSPSAGSNCSSASSKSISVVGHRRRLLSSCGRPVRAAARPTVFCSSVSNAAPDPVEPVVGEGRGQHLDAGRQAVLLGKPARHRDAGHAGEVRRDGGDVVEVHRQRVVELLADPERRGRRRRRDQHVGLLERGREVALDQGPHLLRLPVVGVVVAAGERVGAEDDPPLHLLAEAGVAGRAHHVLGARVVDPLRDHPQAVAHRVEAGEVGGRLARHDQVVRRQRVHEARAGHLDHLGTRLGHQAYGVVEPGLDPVLVALAAELADHADPDPGQVTRGALAGGLDQRRQRVDRGWWSRAGRDRRSPRGAGPRRARCG